MQNQKQVLITGGSGMIGSRLTTLLIERGYGVSHLGRSRKNSGIKTFTWDPDGDTMESEAITNVDVIIHLAGAGIAEKRWSKQWKKEILDSRIRTTRLLAKTLKQEPNRVKAFISASGINYYGLESHHTGWRESDKCGEDFMARVTVAWEREVANLSNPDMRTVMFRTGVVLSSDSVALNRLAMPVRFFVGAALGSGEQYFNWIHIDDLCKIYIKAIEDEKMVGIYNAVAPDPVTNRVLTKKISNILRRPLWLPAVPAFVVKAIAGEVAEVVLEGGKVSSEKIERSGFEFDFPAIDVALRSILINNR